MKLIVCGASGFVGTEIIRQSLRNSEISSLVALGRRATSPPEDPLPGSDVSKLSNVVVEDFMSYSAQNKSELANADACIWTAAITPTKSKELDPAYVKHVCCDYTLEGLKVMTADRDQSSKPFRFVYVSGAATERDQTKTPPFMPEYCLMRGQLETDILEMASSSKAPIEAYISKPGLILAPGRTAALSPSMEAARARGIELPSLGVTDMVASLIKQALDGFDRDTLENADLIKHGQNALKEIS